MTNFTDVIRWLNDVESKKRYKMLAITYNPSLKQEVLRNGFDMENLPSNVNKFSEMISVILAKHIDQEFIVRLKETKWSWLPDFIQNTDNNAIKIEKYLQAINWKNLSSENSK